MRPDRPTLDFARPPMQPYGQLRQTLRALDAGRVDEADLVRLRHRLAQSFGCEATCVTVGHGSAAIAQLIARAAGAGALSFQAGPAHPEIARVSQAANLIAAVHPLDNGLGWDADTACRRIEQLRPAIVWLSSPNRISGQSLSEATIDALVAAGSHGLVVLDATLATLAERPQDLSRWVRLPHVVLVRSLGPLHGFSGLRLAAAASSPQQAGQMARHQTQIPLNAAALAAGLDALERGPDRRWAILKRQRADMVRRLQAGGFSTWPSDADFVWMGLPDVPRVEAQLLAKGVWVRRGEDLGVRGHVRLAVRPRAEVSMLLNALSHL